MIKAITVIPVILALLSVGCASGPRSAAIGAGYDVTSPQARAGIENWLSDQDVQVLSKSFGSLDGELIFKTPLGHTNIVRYQPWRESMNQDEPRTFIQVVQERADQKRFVDQNYVQGLQQQIVEYVVRVQARKTVTKASE